MSSQEQKEHVVRYIDRLAQKNKAGLEQLITNAQTGGVESAGDSPLRAKAAEGLRAVEQGRVPTPEQIGGLEAIILPNIRPVLDVIDGDFRTDHPLWLKLNTDEAIRVPLQRAIPSIGRIELPGNPSYPYGGTGFVVGDRLVMTNRHVAGIFTSGVGTGARIRPGFRAGVDLRRELDRPTGPTLPVKGVVMVHPYWDMALLELEELPDGVEPLKLAQLDPSAGNMIEVAAIGYPAFDTRNDVTVQNDLFRRVFGVKRLQPGTLGGRQSTESFGKMVDALAHNCSTLGGNSGSALVELQSGHVVALHFGGRYKVINYSVPAFELARDSRVVDAGVTFAQPAPGGTPPWEDWWLGTDGEATSDGRPSDSRRTSSPATSAPSQSRIMPDGSVQIVVPLYVTLRLGSPGAGVTVSTGDALAGDQQHLTEAMVMPWHDENYNSRNGYDPNFLGVSVPMPKPKTPSVVARTKDGRKVLHYQNFSVVMHAERRIALFTASNVTAEAKLKKPEKGKSYSRKALSGLGDNDQERWFPDPRLDDEFQLPDVFYTRDDGAFDKGHIVRREDVAWGKTYKSLRIANGDTYHVTNCSPQVAGFNRSNAGEDNWGDLENHVLKGAASERYCQFAGPVLDPDDKEFEGRAGGTNRVRVKIPIRYWKLIVVKTEDGLASYAFVQEQDLSDVPLEFAAGPFRRFMVSLDELEELAGVTFPEVVRDADRFGTDEGVEMAFNAGATRPGTPGDEGVVR